MRQLYAFMSVNTRPSPQDTAADSLKKNDASLAETSLIFLYRSLSKPEIRRLTKWLASPVHNQRDDVRELHAYLTGGRNRLHSTPALAKTRVWRRLFPTQPFDDARLRQTLHWSLRATEDFLAYYHWAREDINRQLALVRELRQRDLPDLSARHLGRGRRIQGDIPYRDDRYYRNAYRLAEEADFHRANYRQREPPNFQEIADALDVAYLIEKLRVSCNMLFHQRLHGSSFQLRNIAATVAAAEHFDLAHYPALAIYYYGYRGLTERDEQGANIRRLRQTIGAHGETLSPFDLRHVILMAINLCISNMNRGYEPYVREAFEWYRLGFDRGVVAENDRLTQSTYLNVVSVGLRLREYDWVGPFIARYADYLDPGLRANTEGLARARYYYERGELDPAMRSLVTVDFRHPVYNLLSRTLLLKIYYGLGEFDALESLLDATTTYIRRKDLTDLHRENFSNIARYVRYLSRLVPGDERRRSELRQRIGAERHLTEKKWLLEQLAEDQ